MKRHYDKGNIELEEDGVIDLSVILAKWFNNLQSSSRFASGNYLIYQNWTPAQQRYFDDNRQPEAGGIPIIHSSRLKSGSTFLAPKPLFHMDAEVRVRLEASFEREIERMIVSAFRVPAHILYPHRYKWQRDPKESFMDWSNRLMERGLFDDMKVRTAYQKAVWSSCWAIIRRAIPVINIRPRKDNYEV